MKFRKLFTGLIIVILAVMIPNAVSAQAARSKKIKLSPWVTDKTHGMVVVDVYASLKNVTGIEIKKGKIKKTADKYWKDSWFDDYCYYDKETGKTHSVFYAYENGIYSVRLTVKSGKKYVNYIKISNLEPVSERGKLTANIRKVSEPDSKGNYTITVDYKKELTTSYKTFVGTKVGDVVSIDGRDVEIKDFLTMNEDYETSSQKEFDEYVDCIVVLPKNVGDFYDLDENSYLLDNPEHADFGFVRSYEDEDTYVAYDDYEYWADGSEYYVNLFDTVYTGVKLKVTEDTLVRLAYADRDYYGKNPTISGTDYCAARLGTKTIENAFIPEELDLYIYESYSKKKGFTDTVSEIVEIYTP
ncbi:MAG: hypothetical protein K6E85_14170 [Lachnospiraceae bacterium]|nr:hypothetical protein [Lachnospiraceae bacterium]